MIKAIVPVAGIGSRLRPHTHTQPKALIPVAGKPIIAHITDILIEQGITEIVYVIGYLGDKIQQFITQNYPNIHAHFILQTNGKGVGHAIWLAKDFVKPEDELFILFGDTIIETDLQKVICSKTSSIAVKKVGNPTLFGVAQINAQNMITNLVEKPSIPKSNMAMIGAYYIKEATELMQVLETQITETEKQEYTLTDALMQMINNGIPMSVFNVDKWFDCGKKEILLETNATLLKKEKYKRPDVAKYPDTVFIDPVFIAEGCRIKASIIGPNVSIGEHAIVENSIIKNSIIGPNAHLEYAILDASLIGNDAYLRGMIQKLNLGDSTEINYST